MRRDLDALALVFEAAAGPCPNRDRIREGLAAVFAELRAPRTPNEIRRRRLEVKVAPFFREFEKDTGITRDDLCAPTEGKADPLVEQRDAFVALLVESKDPKFPILQIATLLRRSRTNIRDSYRRHCEAQGHQEAYVGPAIVSARSSHG